MHKIHAYLDDQMVLHLCPKDTVDVILMRYFTKELAAHGLALIDIEKDTAMYHKIKSEKEIKHQE